MEATIRIQNLDDYLKPINAKEFFGKDVSKLAIACRKVMENWLYPYKDCYVSDEKPRLSDAVYIKKSEGKDYTIGQIYGSILEEWYAENPSEKEKELVSRESWEKQRDKQFRIIYGIAKRHKVYLEWCGNNNSCCEGDRWIIIKNGHEIGVMNCY